MFDKILEVKDISREEFEKNKKIAFKHQRKWGIVLSPLFEGKIEALKIKISKIQTGLASYLKRQYNVDAFILKEGDSYYLYVSFKK